VALVTEQELDLFDLAARVSRKFRHALVLHDSGFREVHSQTYASTEHVFFASRLANAPDMSASVMKSSPEVFDEHEVVQRRILTRKQNRASVSGRREGRIYVAEIASHGRGLSGCEVEVLKECVTRWPID
jgi:hypothetical protein